MTVPPAAQLNGQAAQIAIRLRDALAAGNRMYAWAARRGGTAGLIAAGWDPDDAAGFMADMAALRVLAQVYNGQQALPAPRDFAADLADLAGPG